MAIPGSLTSLLPAGPDEIPRRLRDIERYQTEFGPSIAASIKPAMDDIRAQQAITAGLVADLTTAQATLATTASGLATAQATLTAQQATLTAQQASLTTTVNDLAARVTQTVSIATFNTGSLPNDATWHDYGSDIAITIAVPTGKIVVTVGCGESSMNAGGTGSVEGCASFSIPGYAAIGDYVSRTFLAGASTGVGAPLMVQRAFYVTPGTYTIVGKMRAWANGSATASVNFIQPYLTVQVTG